jgi:predicted O-methyltransferase YrrM
VDDLTFITPPAVLAALQADIVLTGFTMSCEWQTGALLRTLAASKAGGKFLEIGTGMGFSTSWLLDGMDAASSLLTVEKEAGNSAVAQKHLGHDSRVEFVVADALDFLGEVSQRRSDSFDFIFADTFPGKFLMLEETLQLLKVGGFYIIDDLLPQPSWPPGHAPKVPELLSSLDQRKDLQLVRLGWASGLVIATKIKAKV